MKTIKKTTLIAAVTAMAAFAVPAMASAAVWTPINANKTLTSTSVKWYISGAGAQFSFECSSSSLGVHVRNPASSTLDITSASFSGCNAYSSQPCGPATVTATALPWPVTTSGSTISFTEHLLVREDWCDQGNTLNVDGPVSGSYSNTTHTLSAAPVYPNMKLTVMGYQLGTISPITSTWHETTNTLALL